MITKQIISYKLYKENGWKIKLRKGNKLSIFKGGMKFNYQTLSLSSKKEVAPIIRFIQNDINHNFNIIED